MQVNTASGVAIAPIGRGMPLLSQELSHEHLLDTVLHTPPAGPCRMPAKRCQIVSVERH